jgi:ComF family protein
MVNNWLKYFQEALYPPVCALCGALTGTNRHICAGCVAELPFNTRHCHRCAVPVDLVLEGPILCGRCQQHPPPFDICRAALRYETPVDRLVGTLKYGHRLVNGQLLAGLLGDHLVTKGLGAPDLLVPAPLHPRRLRERGFNQAVEIACTLGSRFGIPVDRLSCVRQRDTAPQSGLDRKARARNLRGAFRVRRSITATHVVVVDDVVTTGNTVFELAAVLRREAGIRRVDVWAVARTPG